MSTKHAAQLEGWKIGKRSTNPMDDLPLLELTCYSPHILQTKHLIWKSLSIALQPVPSPETF